MEDQELELAAAQIVNAFTQLSLQNLVSQRASKPIAAVFEILKDLMHIRVLNRAPNRIAQQVLLADIGHIRAVIAFREKVIERLVAVWADVFWDRIVRSISKITPRKSNILWRTMSPIAKVALALCGASIVRPAWAEKNTVLSICRDDMGETAQKTSRQPPCSPDFAMYTLILGLGRHPHVS